MSIKKLPKKLIGYGQLLTEVRSILEKGLGRAYQAVDNIRVQTYWQIGERIVREELKHKDRAAYGKRVIDLLIKDLRFSRADLFRMIQFYKLYPIVAAVRRQLTWTHYRQLIVIKDQEERMFYEVQSIKNQWKSRELCRRIRIKEYEKIKKIGKPDLTLPIEIPQAIEIFKDSYDWNFLQLEPGHTEKELEHALISNIRDTLLEFGQGFALLGQQVTLPIANQYNKIDLLFYHRDLQCLVIVDLKKEKFRAEHVGQMNKYLNYFREHEKRPWERAPIGLIICQEKDNEEVHYSLGGLSEKIFVAEYKMKLPSEAEIRRCLRKIEGFVVV